MTPAAAYEALLVVARYVAVSTSGSALTGSMIRNLTDLSPIINQARPTPVNAKATGLHLTASDTPYVTTVLTELVRNLTRN